jgi:hypothetical protein
MLKLLKFFPRWFFSLTVPLINQNTEISKPATTDRKWSGHGTIYVGQLGHDGFMTKAILLELQQQLVPIPSPALRLVHQHYCRILQLQKLYGDFDKAGTFFKL